MAIDAGESTVVGVNMFATGQASTPLHTLQIDPDVERRQVERVRAMRAGRGVGAWAAALAGVARAARDGDNLMPLVIDAVGAGATVGEIADALRDVFGEFRETTNV